MKAITSAKLNCVSARNSRFASPKTLQQGFDGVSYRTASQCASFKATFLSPPIEHLGAEEAIIGDSRLHRLVLETSTLFTGGPFSNNKHPPAGLRPPPAFIGNPNQPSLLIQLDPPTLPY